MGRNGGSGIRLLDALPEDGERRLMLAVLMDAIRILRQPVADRVRSYRVWVEERMWLESAEHIKPFAFVSICNSLGIQPEYVRRCALSNGTAPLPMNGRRYAAKTEETWDRMRRPRQLRIVCNRAHNGNPAVAGSTQDETRKEVDASAIATAVNFGC